MLGLSGSASPSRGDPRAGLVSFNDAVNMNAVNMNLAILPAMRTLGGFPAAYRQSRSRLHGAHYGEASAQLEKAKIAPATKYQKT